MPIFLAGATSVSPFAALGVFPAAVGVREKIITLIGNLFT